MSPDNLQSDNRGLVNHLFVTIPLGPTKSVQIIEVALYKLFVFSNRLLFLIRTMIVSLH